MEIQKYNYPILALYNSDNEFAGEITNPCELNNVRIQIALESKEGYYIVFHSSDGNINIPILPNGDLQRWPYGMYDEEQRQFAILVAIRRKDYDMVNRLIKKLRKL
jgi:hypothetical protein